MGRDNGFCFVHRHTKRASYFTKNLLKSQKTSLQLVKLFSRVVLRVWVYVKTLLHYHYYYCFDLHSVFTRINASLK